MATIRNARPNDARAITELINYYAEQGLMLPKRLIEVYEHLREFVVVEDEDGTIVGCGALRLMWHDLAEIRSLAIAESAQGQGLGRRIVDTLLKEAHELQLARVFVLTYQIGFFKKQGFEVVPKHIFPQKVWLDCKVCPKQHCCDETAMIRVLDAERAAGAEIPEFSMNGTNFIAVSEVAV